MTSSAGNTGGWEAGGQQALYLGNQEAPRGRGIQAVWKEEQMFERRKGGARVFQVKEPAKGGSEGYRSWR